MLNKYKIHILVGAVLAVLLGAYFAGKSDPIGNATRKIQENPVRRHTIDEAAVAKLEYDEHAGGIRTVRKESLTLEQLVALMRRHYGHKLNSPKGVMMLIEDLIRFFKDKGGNWLQDLHEALWLAFPDRAAEIFAKVEKLLKYNEFLRDYNKNLPAMGSDESFEQLWKKRYEYFGEDAAKSIWANEMWNHNISQSLKKIEAGSLGGTDVRSKAKAYSQAIDTAVGSQAKWYKENHAVNLSQQFLNLGSVQAEIGALPTAGRHEVLRDIRRELGFDEGAVKRLENLDTTRDQRWNTGTEYMKERQSLTAQYSGSQLEAELEKLRARLLGSEAEFIKNEEASGYYRYLQKRTYGVD